MADLIISQPMTFTVDVKNGLIERPQRESLMRGDKMANRIIVELVDGSEPFDITGVTVKGKFCRPPNGDEIDLAGEAKSNVAEVQLTDQCYTSGGHYEARVILVLGEVERTVLFISGDVIKSGSGNAAGDEETDGTGSGLPAGGTDGQVLVKVSSAQGDAIWKTLTAADVGALPSDGTAVNANALNGKDAKYYSHPRNLLDNSDFTNPVNQRGQTTYTGSAIYTIDRWRTYQATSKGTVTVNNGYITLNAVDGTIFFFCQYFPKGYLTADKYTLAYCRGDGSIGINNNPIVVGTDFDYVTVNTVGTVDLKWIALYEGTYTADNLPPYVYKGYAAELAECQRYFHGNTGNLNAWSVAINAGGYLIIKLPTNGTMLKEITPSITNNSQGDTQILQGGSWVTLDIAPFQANTVFVGRNEVVIQAPANTFTGITTEVGKSYLIRRVPNISCDL